MNSKVIILAIAAVMLSSSLAVAFDSTAASHGPNMNATSAAVSGTPYLGSVTIAANGSVSNPSVISQSGNTYTLTSGINGTVTDLRNNSVLNGNGFTINGNSSYAIVSTDVTGLTVENLVIVNAKVGFELTSGSNIVFKGNTVNGSTFNSYLTDLYYSDNVTIENNVFSFSNTVTSSYAVYAYSVSSLNVSYNMFSGSTYYYFVYGDMVGQFSGWHNTVMSTYSGAYAFYMEYGGSAILGYNYINYTSEGVYVYWQQSLISLHNQIYNSDYGLDGQYISTFISSHDSLPGNYYPLYVYEVGATLAKYDNLSGSSYGVYSEYSANVTITNSNISNASNEGVYAYEGGSINLYNDQLNMVSTSVYGVYAEYMSGPVNLVGVSIITPSYYGLYLYYSPYFNVVDSYINATYNIYADTSIFGANVSNNTFVTTNTGYTLYQNDYDYLYNLVFTNNTIISPATDWADYGVYLYVYYASSNIVISNNSFTNNYYPIYLYSDYYNGVNVWVQNNTIVNSDYAIEIEGFLTLHVTGNMIQNVTGEGIYLYLYEAGIATVSYNTIVNLPGFGGFSYGIDMEGFYVGTSVVSYNTILNGGSSSTGIYFEENVNSLVYGNYVSNSDYAYYLYYYNDVMWFFNNTASNSYYGIYSEENGNLSIYSNYFINDNYSLVSYYDWLVYLYANTFVDNFTTSGSTPTVYFLSVYDPYGTYTIYHNNFLNETSGYTVANYLTTGTGYAPIYMNAALPVGGNFWSNYTGHGSNGIGTTPMTVYGQYTDYYPLTSMWTSPTVTFVETGLPSGTSWSVSLNSSMQTSTAASIVYGLTNAVYSNVTYSVSQVQGYVASVTSGTVYLNGASSVITVAFTPYNYSVTFTESGLQSGTSWSVTLNGVTQTSTTATVAFSVPNGTYSYTINSVSGYSGGSVNGTITVNGAAVSESASYTLITYMVTVVESGLPSGSSWNATLTGSGGASYSVTSTSTSAQIAVAPGTYTVNVTGPSGYSVTLQSSTLTITNSSSALVAQFGSTSHATTSSSNSNSNSIYEGLGIGVVIGAVAAFLAAIFVLPAVRGGKKKDQQ